MGSARCRHGCRIISIILALVCCLTPAALAADEGNSIYSLAADTKVVSSDRSTGSWTAFDYGVSTNGSYSAVYISNNEDFWLYTNHSIARGFANLWNKLDNIKSDTLSINSYCSSINNSLSSILTNSNSIPALVTNLWGNPNSSKSVYYLDSLGNISSSSVSSVGDILSYSSINSLYAGFWAKENNDALWSIAGGINTVNTNLGTINTSLGTINTSVGTVDTDLNTLTSKVFDNTSPSGNSAYYHTGVLQYSSVNYPSYLVTTSTGYKVATGGDMGTVTSLRDYLDLINRNLIVQANMVFNFDRGNSPYTQYRYNLSDNLSSNWTVRSLADSVTYGFTDLVDSVGRLATIFASDDDMQAREDADPQIQQAQEDFVSLDGAASVKLGDMGSAKDVSAQMQQSLNTGVSPSTAFSYFGTNGGLFALFSQDIKDDMDAVPQTRGGEEIVDFYSSNLEKIGVPFDDISK